MAPKVAMKPKKKNDKVAILDWPFDISIDVDKKVTRTNNRLAFGTTQSRTYFPQDPGRHRFGIYYAMNKAAVDVPNPSYFPSDDRLRKPISTKGYGIGGLSGPRFAKLLQEANPSPDAYQEEYVATPLTVTFAALKHKKPKLKRPTQIESDEKIDKEKPVVSVSQNTPELTKEDLRRFCMQKYVGFGSGLNVSRFGKPNNIKNVGVGYYDLDTNNKYQLAKTHSFGSKPVMLIPSTVTRCYYKGFDKCFECDNVLQTTDYYRTWKRIENPFYNVHPLDRVGTSDKDNLFLREQAEMENISGVSNQKFVFVTLCRRCYCRGKRGESRFWDRKEISKIFHKTRHCNFIHEHKNLPLFTHKISCKTARNIRLKETMLKTYYEDSCPRIFKEM